LACLPAASCSGLRTWVALRRLRTSSTLIQLITPASLRRLYPEHTMLTCWPAFCSGLKTWVDLSRKKCPALLSGSQPHQCANLIQKVLCCLVCSASCLLQWFEDLGGFEKAENMQCFYPVDRNCNIAPTVPRTYAVVLFLLPPASCSGLRTWVALRRLKTSSTLWRGPSRQWSSSAAASSTGPPSTSPR
jgi:hypothetical protein